jgi:urease accessory protein
MRISMTEAPALYRLLTWLSPAYPTGAFSYSHGLEYAVEAGLVAERAGLVAWIGRILQAGAGWIDALLLAEAWRAAQRNDLARLDTTAELAAAWRGSAEMALESEAQGQAFLTVTRAAWPHPLFDRLAERQGPVALAVAVGAAAAAHGVDLAPSLRGYLHGIAGNLVSAGVRLIPLGQTEGQRAMAGLETAVAGAAERALGGSLDEAGTAAPLVDWCSMRHETQYTRLFRS